MNWKGGITMKTKLAFVLAALTLVFYAGCERQPQTLGSFDRIIVLCDSTLYRNIEPELSAALQREILTPQPEYLFTLVNREPGDISDLKRYRNLLLVGTLESTGTTKGLLDQMLTEKARASVANGENVMFQKTNAWSKDQLLGVLVARDVESLKSRIVEEKDRLFDMFDSHTREVLGRTLYSGHEKKDIEKQLLERHGWAVRVQHDYFVAIDSADARFVWLRRLGPQRWLSVYYEEVDDPSILSKEWIIETRNRLGREFWNGDVIVENDDIKANESKVNFNDRYAIQVDGIWENEKMVVGGPFRSYGFYNESDGRLYLIDLAVLAPGERKFPYLRQLEAMAFTFYTKPTK